ncbi:insecticyanin-A [Aphomia sociella]
MFKTIFIFFTVTLSFYVSNCQVLQFGECPDVETMKYFDLERFLGLWYEIERFPAWYEHSGHCAYKRIQACGRKVEIEHAYVKDGIQYVLHVNSSYTPGDKAVFIIEESNIDPIGIPFSVINTDYENYAVVYGCKYNENMDIKYISGWILSRSLTLSPEQQMQARMELNSLPFANAAYLERVNQGENDCTHHWVAHIQSESINENATVDND